MQYIVSVKLSAKSKELLAYLRLKRFNIYGFSRTGAIDNADTPHNDSSTHHHRWTHYQCIYNSIYPPPQEVIKKINEGLSRGTVLGYNIIVQ